MQVAISATRTGSTFDLSASGKFLLFSASQLPCSQGFAEPDTRHCRNAESPGAEMQKVVEQKRHDKGQTDAITSDFLKMVIYLFSQCFRSAESLMLRSLNCDKGPVAAN